MKVKNQIAELRLQRGLSQVQFAKELQVTRQTVHAIETGKYCPSLELAIKILRLFDLPLEAVFQLEDNHE